MFGVRIYVRVINFFRINSSWDGMEFILICFAILLFFKFLFRDVGSKLIKSLRQQIFNGFWNKFKSSYSQAYCFELQNGWNDWQLRLESLSNNFFLLLDMKFFVNFLTWENLLETWLLCLISIKCMSSWNKCSSNFEVVLFELQIKI